VTQELARIVEEVQAALAGPCRVAKGTPIAVACSGGADSVALVAALAPLKSIWPLLGVFHVDHGMRDAAAEVHSARVAAERAGVGFTRLTLTLEGGANLQARAREMRYSALETAVPAEALIATGHTRTDQAETVLQRLVRGAGVRGLRGVHWRQGRLVRPMLNVPREVTRAAALPFAEDPTNATDRFQRNRIRRHVMPLLAEENPDIEATLARVASQAAGDFELLQACLKRASLYGEELAGARPAVAEAWLRAMWPGGVSSSRSAVSRFATALVAGNGHGPIRVDPETLVSLVDGALVVKSEIDPRRRVVAHGIGSYRLGDVVLVISAGGGEQPPRVPNADAAWTAETWLKSGDLTWPLTLQRHAGRDAARRPGDPAPDALRLVDGTGAWLWDVGRGGFVRAAGRDLRVTVFEP